MKCRQWLGLAVTLSQIVQGSFHVMEIDPFIIESTSGLIDNSFWKTVKTLKNDLKQYENHLNPDEVDDWTKCILAIVENIESFGGNHSGLLTALTMIDASTKFRSGILRGNLVDLGQYDECIEITRQNIEFQIPESNYSLVTSYTGQHCVLSLTLAHSFQGIKEDEVITFGLSRCYPSTCKPEHIQKIWNTVMEIPNLELESTMNLTLIPRVSPDKCHTSERPTLDGVDWFVLFLGVALVCIGIICTLIDIYHLKKALQNRKPTISEQLVLSFSIYTNGTKLFSTSQNSDQMGCINGMKFCSICWVILGHRYMYIASSPLVNSADIAKTLQQWHKMIIYNGILSVDTFFLISGLLNAYIFFNLMDKKVTYNIFTVLFGYVHRYIRLTPSYFMMIGITATWIYRTGSGPLWDQIVGGEKHNCRIHWWSNLLYVNNYLNPLSNCMMQSWYLAADMQMFWLSPLLIYPLYRWPKIGFANLFIALAASVASPFAVSYTNDIRAPIPIFSKDPNRKGFEMKMLYLPTHTKTVSYVFGILVGYLIQRHKTRKLKFRMNWIINGVGWILGPTSLLYGLFGCYPLFQADQSYTQLEVSLYLGFYRLFWSIGVGWIIVSCVSGYGGPVNLLLSLKPFGPLGRLSYCIYLTHIFVLIHKIGSIRTAMYYTDYDQVITFLGEVILISTCALILSLLLESPMMGIEKIIFGERGRTSPKRTRSTPNREIEEHPA